MNGEAKINLTEGQVRATVELLVRQNRFGSVSEVADELGIARSGLYRYMTEGLPSRMNRTVRRRLVEWATETGVLETAEAEGGVFL